MLKYYLLKPPLTFPEAFPIVIVFICLLFGVLLQWFKEDVIDASTKKGINFCLFFFGLIGAVAALVDSCNNSQDQKQIGLNVDTVKVKVDTVKTTTTETKKVVDSNLTLSELTFKISQQIKELNKINHEVISNTKKLVEQSKDLVINLNYDVTGGTSIPLITSQIVEDTYDPTVKYYKMGLPDPTGKWLLRIYIQNTGNNKLTDVKLSQAHPAGKTYFDPIPDPLPFPSGSTLQRHHPAELVKQVELADIHPINLETGEPDSYSFDNYNTYLIYVTWSNLVYIYTYTLIEGKPYVDRTENYIYKNKNYPTSKELVAAITKDLKID